MTRQVVEYAHDHGVVVEGELGRLAGIEDKVNVSAEDASYTRPEEVEEFVGKTGVDSLAIAIGTSHGAYKFTAAQCTRNEKGILVPPPLRFDILEEVSKRLPGFPIVLHGSSSVPQEFVKMINENGGKMPDAVGIPEEQLRKAASMSVCTINIGLRPAPGHDRHHPLDFSEHPDHFDPRQYLKPARANIKKLVQHKLVDVLGCNGKAKPKHFAPPHIMGRRFVQSGGEGERMNPWKSERCREISPRTRLGTATAFSSLPTMASMPRSSAPAGNLSNG